jgi:hypothetical protein
MARRLMVFQSFMCGCLVGLAICVNTSAQAQEQPPRLLLDAAHCLAIKGFLPAAKTASLSSGYLVDSKSYPGEKVLYVVVYASPQHSEGMVFSIFLTQKGARTVFNIQNNGKFLRSTKEGAAFRREAVDFVDGGDPLGGIWTQEHIALAIKDIGRQPIVDVPVQNLLNPSAAVQCESYAAARRGP